MTTYDAPPSGHATRVTPDPIPASEGTALPLPASSTLPLAARVAHHLREHGPLDDQKDLHVDAARIVLRDLMTPVARTETLPLMQALGRILYDDIAAPMDVPAFDNSAMDGYAFDGSQLRQADPTAARDAGARSGDHGTMPALTLKVIGRAYAGHPLKATVGAGECARVMTGAPMPDGTDTVIPHEYATLVNARSSDMPQLVELPMSGFRRGANRRLAGEDIRENTAVFRAGRLLRASDLGVLASLGIAEVRVRARLRVAFFSTGDELHPVGSPLPTGGVYDSNRYTLYGMLTRLGVEPIDLGVVRDDPHALQTALATAARCADAIVSSGGVSAGDADFVRDVFQSAGDIVFWKMAMRPGRPFAFGMIARGTADTSDGSGSASQQGAPEKSGETIPFFGLPGNPVAVAASFYHLVRDALLMAMGAIQEAPPRVAARLAAPIRKRPGRTEFARGIATRLGVGHTSAPSTRVAGGAADAEAGLSAVHPEWEGQWQVTLTGAQGSGMLSSMSKGNCFVILPHDSGDLQAGDQTDIVFFEGLL